MTTAELMWVNWIGFIAAILAFSIATYLQLLVRKQVKPRYVIGFIWMGFALFFLSIKVEFFSSRTLTILKFIGYCLFIGLEIAGVRVAMADVE